MSTFPAAGYMSNNARTEGEMKTAFEDQLAAIKEGPGQSAASTLTISSGSVTPTGAVHFIDTEGAAATDDLTNIALTNHPDGRILIIEAFNAPTRDVNVVYGAGGAGEIILVEASDFTLDQPRKGLILQRRGTQWVEIDRFFGENFPDLRTFYQVASATHATTHAIGGADAFTATDFLDAACRRLRTSDGVTLAMSVITDGEFLQRSGASIISAAGGGGGVGDMNSQTFTASGTWTRPASVDTVLISGTAGGGGGSGNKSGSVGGDGGGAGDSNFNVRVTGLAADVSVTIGAGGSGGSSLNAGTAGGTSSFGAFVSFAGGGAGDAAGNPGAAGGPTTRSQQGEEGVGVSSQPVLGHGGGNLFSPGGKWANDNTVPVAPPFGGGGAGGVTSGSGAGAAGGAGRIDVVWVE